MFERGRVGGAIDWSKLHHSHREYNAISQLMQWLPLIVWTGYEMHRVDHKQAATLSHIVYKQPLKHAIYFTLYAANIFFFFLPHLLLSALS